MFGLSFLIGRESGARFCNQSQSEVKQNQSKTQTTFDTQLKTALLSLQSKLVAVIMGKCLRTTEELSPTATLLFRPLFFGPNKCSAIFLCKRACLKCKHEINTKIILSHLIYLTV